MKCPVDSSSPVEPLVITLWSWEQCTRNILRYHKWLSDRNAWIYFISQPTKIGGYCLNSYWPGGYTRNGLKYLQRSCQSKLCVYRSTCSFLFVWVYVVMKPGIVFLYVSFSVTFLFLDVVDLCTFFILMSCRGIRVFSIYANSDYFNRVPNFTYDRSIQMHWGFGLVRKVGNCWQDGILFSFLKLIPYHLN